VEESRDQDVGIGDAVVAEDAERDPQDVVGVRLAGAALVGVEVLGPPGGVGDGVADARWKSAEFVGPGRPVRRPR
jgi:hypothetical protein